MKGGLLFPVQPAGRKRIIADFSLLITAVIWGANFTIIKQTLLEVPPMLFLGLRFLLAFLPLAPFLCAAGWRPASSVGWLQGAVIGGLLFAGFAAQTLGLRYTTPGLSGFLTGIYVLLVPVLGILIQRRLPGRAAFTGAVLAACGLGLLSWHGQTGFGPGALLTLAGALFFALHFWALGCWSAGLHPLFLTAVQMLVTGVCSLLLALFTEPVRMHFSLFGWGGIVYGAFLGSLGAYFIQTWAQRFTPPGRAAVLLSTESVFAALFSICLGMETVTPGKILGFAFIFAGILVAELFAPEGEPSPPPGRKGKAGGAGGEKPV